MHQEVRLHGHLNDTIEYFATAAGRDAYGRHFYETAGDTLRLFSPGNELVLDARGVAHRGNGGSFCEYMFGVDLPLPDLAKKEVRNRLVLYGASYGKNGGLSFSDQTEGVRNHAEIFFEGNAVCNYFFFLTGSVAGPMREQQEEIARLLGKMLKRTDSIEQEDDAALLDEIFGLLGHRSSFYLVKLVHKPHKHYHDVFRDLYHAHRVIPEAEFGKLQQLAEHYGIDKYQQERIRIDVMYKHPENRRIVDEYKEILIACHRKGSINSLDNARLTRLKTLSVRKKIPAALFHTLDEMLKHDKLVDLDEQDYIAETRQILAGIFLQERDIDASIEREDMLKLLNAKRRASENRDHTFEQILLETGKACDERIRDGAPMGLLESFSYIVTFFDRYDNASAYINQLAFMENIRPSEEMVRSLMGNRRAFNELAPDLFDRLFFTGILENKYLTRFGRKKILCLRQGLERIEEGRLTVQGMLQQLHAIEDEEELYELLLEHVKERIRSFYSKYSTRAEQEELRREVSEELRNKDIRAAEVPRELFHDVVVNIKKEAIYLHNLLPRVVAEQDLALREDFLDNSGLDRFYVEELEREYFEHNGLDPQNLDQLRKGARA